MSASEPDSQWTTLTDNGLSAYRRHDLINAEKLLSKALLKSHEFQGVDVRRLKSMNNLAMVFVAQKRYNEALAVFDSVVRMSEKVVAPVAVSFSGDPSKVSSMQVATESMRALSQSVRLYRALGKVKLADDAQTKLVKLAKKVRVSDAVETATSGKQ